jgi:hypothetical protein
MPRPAITREQYDEIKADRDQWRDRYDTLFAAYEKLRPTHSPAGPLRVTPGREEPGMASLKATEAAMNNPKIAAIADNLQREKPELSRLGAMIEAKRLDDIARGRAVAPSAASVNMPPAR